MWFFDLLFVCTLVGLYSFDIIHVRTAIMLPFGVVFLQTIGLLSHFWTYMYVLVLILMVPLGTVKYDQQFFCTREAYDVVMFYHSTFAVILAIFFGLVYDTLPLFMILLYVVVFGYKAAAHYMRVYPTTTLFSWARIVE